MNVVIRALAILFTLTGTSQAALSSQDEAHIAWSPAPGDAFRVASTLTLKCLDDRYALDTETRLIVRFVVVRVNDDGAVHVEGTLKLYATKGNHPLAKKPIDMLWDATGEKVHTRGEIPERTLKRFEEPIEAKVDAQGRVTSDWGFLKLRYLPRSFRGCFVGFPVRPSEREAAKGAVWKTEVEEHKYEATLSSQLSGMADGKATIETDYTSVSTEDASFKRAGKLSTWLNSKDGRPARCEVMYTWPFVASAGRMAIKGTIESKIRFE